MFYRMTRIHFEDDNFDDLLTWAETARPRPTSVGRSRADHFRAAAQPEGVPRGAPAGQAGAGRNDAYGRARELLQQGVAPAEVARRVGLGIAEVNVLRRMQG